MKESDLQEIREAVENEGFDYAFIHYSDFKEVKDKKFHQLRNALVKARKELAKYIGVDEEC